MGAGALGKQWRGPRCGLWCFLGGCGGVKRRNPTAFLSPAACLEAGLATELWVGGRQEGGPAGRRSRAGWAMGPSCLVARGRLRVPAAAPEHGHPDPIGYSCRGRISLSVALGSPPSGESRGCSGEKRESGARRDLQGCRRLNSALQQEGCAGEGRERRLRVPESFALCNRRVRARFTSSSLTTELRGRSCSVRAQLPLPEPSPRSTSPEPLLSAQGLKLGARLWEKRGRSMFEWKMWFSCRGL